MENKTGIKTKIQGLNKRSDFAAELQTQPSSLGRVFIYNAERNLQFRSICNLISQPHDREVS